MCRLDRVGSLAGVGTAEKSVSERASDTLPSKRLVGDLNIVYIRDIAPADMRHRRNFIYYDPTLGGLRLGGKR